MEHRPYPRIHGAPSEHAAPSTWVATEKVHGANLVVATDGGAVRVGKRKAWLGDGDAFFGWQLLRPALAHAALALWRALDRPPLVRLHGELYGGAYPHPDVAPVPGNAPVQTGVWYAPDVRFSLFDVQVEARDGASFLAHRELEALAREHGLEVVPALARGTRGELDGLPVRFATRVPALLGLPPLAGNVAEGYVLKPDARMPVAARPAVKRKIPEFDEARFDDGAAWDPDARLPLEALRARAASLVNAARLASARSKVGDDPAALCDEAALDALVDLEAAFPAAMGALDEAALDALRDEVARRVRALAGEGSPP
ncbi:MAG: RNA ligase family protein [Polyangiales bacterium]